MRFSVTATGAVAVDLEGELELGPCCGLIAEGDFAGQPYALALRATGDHLQAHSGDDLLFEGPVPGELSHALRIGLTRMGVLHNVAMLVGGAPPDHADGGVEDWVRTSEHKHVERDGQPGIAFDLTVAGQPSGHATLWLDDRGWPASREQSVDFPEGTMKVVEVYEFSESEPSAAASLALASVPSGP